MKRREVWCQALAYCGDFLSLMIVCMACLGWAIYRAWTVDGLICYVAAIALWIKSKKVLNRMERDAGKG